MMPEVSSRRRKTEAAVTYITEKDINRTLYHFNSSGVATACTNASVIPEKRGKEMRGEKTKFEACMRRIEGEGMKQREERRGEEGTVDSYNCHINAIPREHSTRFRPTEFVVEGVQK